MNERVGVWALVGRIKGVIQIQAIISGRALSTDTTPPDPPPSSCVCVGKLYALWKCATLGYLALAFDAFSNCLLPFTFRVCMRLAASVREKIRFYIWALKLIFYASYLCNSFIFTYCRPFCMLNALAICILLCLSVLCLLCSDFSLLASSRLLCILWSAHTTRRIPNAALSRYLCRPRVAFI